MKLKMIITGLLICFFVAQSFIGSPEDFSEMLPKLSDYNIFQDRPADLVPSKEFKQYEISNTLFSDYAEKQRLIKVPHGKFIRAVDDGLPDFPEGTILAKTFYYDNDQRDKTKGKRIIETRILVKRNSTWNAGTYLWNDEQAEAFLTTTSSKVNINWIDEKGSEKLISYRVPSNKECMSCHKYENDIMPIGFKLRNLNIEVTRNLVKINQLKYFRDISLFGDINPASFSTVPSWQDHSKTLEQRARAYLDISCAHCHNQKGYCAAANLNLGYETDFAQTNISDKKKTCSQFHETGPHAFVWRKDCARRRTCAHRGIY